MKALTVVPLKADSAALSEMPEPPEADGPVLVETLAIGICGTDIEILSGQYGWPPPGEERLVLGHESLGRVLEAPAGGKLAEGDLVVGIVRRPDPVPCPNCAVMEWDFCRNGLYTERGIKQHHGYCSERYRNTPDFTVKVDSSLGTLGVLLEPTSVVAKAWEEVDRVGGRAHWEPKTVLVTGAGPIGLLAALIGVQRGMEVHVLDQVTAGLKPDLVAALGATYHTGTVGHGVPRCGRHRRVHRRPCPRVRLHVERRHRRRGLPDRRLLGGTHHRNGRRPAQPEHGAGERRGRRIGQRQPPPLRGGRGRAGQGRPLLARASGDSARPLDTWQDAIQRHPDDVKVVIEVNKA